MERTAPMTATFAAATDLEHDGLQDNPLNLMCSPDVLLRATLTYLCVRYSYLQNVHWNTELMLSEVILTTSDPVTHLQG